MSDKGKYNDTLASLYNTRKGGFVSLKIDARNYDAFQKLQIGGKLLIKIVSAESKAKFRNPDTAPDAFLEFMSAESVAQYEKENPRRTESGGI